MIELFLRKAELSDKKLCFSIILLQIYKKVFFSFKINEKLLKLNINLKKYFFQIVSN